MHMKKSSSWAVFIRRTYIFYVFLGILAIVSLIYFYYYIPANQKEFNERGSRVLKRLVVNLLARTDAMDSAFSESSLDYARLIERNGAYANLYNSTHYALLDTFTNQPNVTVEKRHEWLMVFPLRVRQKSMQIRVEDFLQ